MNRALQPVELHRHQQENNIKKKPLSQAKLFKKIKKTEAKQLLTKRIRVSNARKMYLFGEMILNKNLKEPMFKQ